MNKVKIICDSTCDISLDILKQNDIEMIPLKVTLKGKVYKDLLEITTDKLFQKIEEEGELSKSSAITPLEFEEVFSKYVNDGYDVVFISLGSALSSSYSSAYLTSLDFENRVYVIDSKNLSSAIGLLILEVIKMKDNGLSALEIYEKALEIVPKIQCSFILNTMEYLYKGGRCSGIGFYFGKVFHLHPIIKMEEGKLSIHHLPRGHMNKGIDIIIEEFKKEYDENKVHLGTVMITHACNEEARDYIYEKLSAFVPKENLMINSAGCVISAHCGPKCVGILYINK